MKPWLRRAALGLVCAFAVVGVVVVLQIAGVPLFGSACERQVLASSVSPDGLQVAEHVRLSCASEGTVTHTLSIGPAVAGAGSRYEGHQLFERDQMAERSARIEPAVLWWEANDRLRVIYPRGTDYLDQSELLGVTVRAAHRDDLE